MKGTRLLIAVPLLAATFGAQAADDARRPLYYQDPSGTPFYAAAPQKADDAVAVGLAIASAALELQAVTVARWRPRSWGESGIHDGDMVHRSRFLG